jgi:hypothetical protein
MVDVASRSVPSIDLQGPCQLSLDELVRRFPQKLMRCRVHTEGDARVLFTNILTLVVGEELVGRKTTLGRVRVCVCERERELAQGRLTGIEGRDDYTWSGCEWILLWSLNTTTSFRFPCKELSQDSEGTLSRALDFCADQVQAGRRNEALGRVLLLPFCKVLPSIATESFPCISCFFCR